MQIFVKWKCFIKQVKKLLLLFLPVIGGNDQFTFTDFIHVYIYYDNQITENIILLCCYNVFIPHQPPVRYV